MRFAIEQSPPHDPNAFKRRFAWLPTRVSPFRVIWLEGYWRRYVETDPGTWAGGDRGYFEYCHDGETWRGPEFGS